MTVAECYLSASNPAKNGLIMKYPLDFRHKFSVRTYSLIFFRPIMVLSRLESDFITSQFTGKMTLAEWSNACFHGDYQGHVYLIFWNIWMALK